MVTDPTWEIMASNVISQPACVTIKFNVFIKICKYKRLHEGHHFIPMALKVDDTLGHDMDCFIGECACLFHNKRSGCHLSLSFYI